MLIIEVKYTIRRLQLSSYICHHHTLRKAALFEASEKNIAD